jgi:hypothetical protein
MKAENCSQVVERAGYVRRQITQAAGLWHRRGELFFRTCPTDQAVKGGGGEQKCARKIITGRFLAANNENQPVTIVSVPGIPWITAKSNGAYEVFVRKLSCLGKCEHREVF